LGGGTRPGEPTRWRDPALDAVRAGAIWLVIFSHGIVNLLHPIPEAMVPVYFITSTVGVEFFFSLSGFLIGRILLDIEARGITVASVGRFLTRRWLRTLPLYYIFFAVGTCYRPVDTHTAIGVLSMTQNLWPPFDLPVFFQQSWSLTIEEYSYLLLPIFAFIFQRTGRPVLIAVLAVTALSIACRIGLEGHQTFGEVRLSAIGRLDAIVYGLCAAMIERYYLASYQRHHRMIVGVALVIVVVQLILFAYPEDLDNLYGRLLAFPLFAAGVAAFLPGICRMGPRLPAFHGVVNATSQLSYSLYVVHLVCAAGAQMALSEWPLLIRIAAYLASSYCLATACRILVELPFMRLRPRQFPQETQPRWVNTVAAPPDP
jgi:peptidoglycan/LPS O-acetylase OafA/YrhL